MNIEKKLGQLAGADKHFQKQPIAIESVSDDEALDTSL
jgi:hypothetical protein